MTYPVILNVLAVDDNPADLLLLQRNLTKVTAFTVRYEGVGTLAEAQARLHDGAKYDVVFMDYRLGEEDGVEGIRSLRDSGHLIPLILMTGQGSERVAAQSRRVGASDYLSKDDMTPALLQECLDFVLGEYRRERRDSRAIKDALTDGLTGLFVKDYLSRRATEEFARAGRYETPLSVVMLDLDHFKQVNDTHGHLAGDEVLRRCAEVIRVTLRETDIAGRFGGEEFCVVLPQCAREDAAAIAERVRTGIENLRIDYNGSIIPVTTSAGVAALDESMPSVETLIAAADRALYQAKRTGRNRVCVAQLPTSQAA